MPPPSDPFWHALRGQRRGHTRTTSGGGLCEDGQIEFASCETRGSRTDGSNAELQSREGRSIDGGNSHISEEKCQDFLPGLTDFYEKLRRVHFLPIQEANQKNTIAAPTILKDWTLALFKSEADWRGQGIMVRKPRGTLTQLHGMPGPSSAMVGEGDQQLGLASLHLPPKSTVDETETILSEWGRMAAMQQKRFADRL